MICYSLIKNPVGKNANDYIATVTDRKSKNLQDIIDFMVAEGTGLTRPQAQAYFEKFFQTIEHFTEMGYSINTPVLRTNLTVSGIFSGKDDFFDPVRHKVNIRLVTGTRLKKLESKLKLNKTTFSVTAPIPEELFDLSSRTTNQQLTAGGIARIKGYNLKFEINDEEQGVFIIPEKEPEKEIRVEMYSLVKPSELSFLIPDIVPGSYQVKVKVLPRNHSTIRKEILSDTLYVI